MKLEVNFLGKFAKFTKILTNTGAPFSNCTRLRRCMQSHLNYHLSLTPLTFNGIYNLDATEILCDITNGSFLSNITLQDMLYHLTLENGSPSVIPTCTATVRRG